MLKAFVLKLVLIGCVQSQSSESPKYDSSSSAVRNYDNLTRIEDVLELFSMDVIGSQWKSIYSRLSHHCANDMVAYLSGLEKKEIWAIKSKFSSRFCNRLLTERLNESENGPKFHFSSLIKKKRSEERRKIFYTPKVLHIDHVNSARKQSNKAQDRRRSVGRECARAGKHENHLNLI